MNENKYYDEIKELIVNNEVFEKIKNKEYVRLSDEAKNKLIINESLNIKDTIPEPILIPISKNYDKEKLNEKLLHTIIVDNIKEFMKQLGNGYSFIEDEYRIKIGDKFNYIDKYLKKDNHNKTIGILLVKENNEYVLYYSDGNIIPITFELKNI